MNRRPGLGLLGLGLLAIGCGDNVAVMDDAAPVPAPDAAPARNDLDDAPPDVAYQGDVARFIDVTTATHHLVIDAATGTTTVTSTLVFEQRAAGYPLFDVVQQPTEGAIDGVAVSGFPVLPEAGDMRVVPVLLAAGTHELTLTAPLPDVTRDVGAEWAAWFGLADFTKRRYTERYYPSNLLYDRFPVELTIDVTNADDTYTVLTNGDVLADDGRTFVVAYPAWYRASAPFLRIVDDDVVCDRETTLASVDGRQVPLRVFTEAALCDAEVEARLDEFVLVVTESFAWLEAHLGVYPQAKLLVATRSPSFDYSMEYAGAFEGGAVFHELGHQWFSRSTFPTSGRDEWIDEAITTFVTDGDDALWLPPVFATAVPSNPLPVVDVANPYQRGMYVDAPALTDPYEAAELFYAYETWFAEAGLDLFAFLAELHVAHVHDNITTEELRAALVEVLPAKDAAFERYVYGP